MPNLEVKSKDIAAIIIGCEIQTCRRSLGMSQTQLAHGVCSQSLLSLIEHGLQLPMPDILKSLAYTLKSDVLLKFADKLEEDNLVLDLSSPELIERLTYFFLNFDFKWTSSHEELALYLCEYSYEHGDLDLSKKLSGAIIKSKVKLPNSAYAKAHFFLGSALIRELNFQEGIEALESVLDKLEYMNPDFRGKLLYNLAYAYGEKDIQSIALSHSLKAAEIFRRNDLYNFYGRTLAQLGVIYLRMNQIKNSLNALSKSYDLLLSTGGSLKDIARIECSLATAYFQYEDYAQVNFWGNKAIETGVKAEDIRSVFMGHRELIAMHIITNSLGSSLCSYVNKAIRLAEELNDPVCLIEIHLIGGIALHDIDFVKKAFVLTASAGLPIYRAEISDYLSYLYERENNTNKAHYYKDIAYTSYRKYAQENFKRPLLTGILPTHDFKK